MSSTLADFYTQMKPFLTGAQTLDQTREALGASPSGDENFTFYRVLAQRNVFKIMRELYAPLHTLVRRDEPEAWGRLVRAYVVAHPPGGRHPTCCGEAFSDFLAQRREHEPAQPAVYEELADFCWVRSYVYGAPDREDDGFDQRLFVRQYTYRVHELAAALERDRQAPVPEPQPVVLIIYRHARSLQTRLFLPSAAGLVALAQRQGAQIPEPLRVVPAPDVAEADAQLVAHGVLVPRPG